MGPSSDASVQAIERLRGIYLQRTIQLASVDDRTILLTRNDEAPAVWNRVGTC